MDPMSTPARQPLAPASAATRPSLLGRDYWLVLSTPHPDTTVADIHRLADEHVAWLLKLETEGTVFLSGPLVVGPRTSPGSGVTVLRAPTEQNAAAIAATDPFVLAGLRSFEVFGWRLNEGAISIQLSLGTGGYTWT
jgi:uncharacterized protein YciI